jgi:hypothetical protein
VAAGGTGSGALAGVLGGATPGAAVGVVGIAANVLLRPAFPSSGPLLSRSASGTFAAEATAVFGPAESRRSSGLRALGITIILGLPIPASNPVAELPVGTSDNTTTGAGASDARKNESAKDKKSKGDQRPPDEKDPN